MITNTRTFTQGFCKHKETIVYTQSIFLRGHLKRFCLITECPRILTEDVIIIVTALLEMSSRMEHFTHLGTHTWFGDFFSSGTPLLKVVWQELQRGAGGCLYGPTSPSPTVQARKELSSAAAPTDESHFQLVPSPLTPTEEPCSAQRVAHTPGLSEECTHCPSKIKLISTCRKG